MSNEIIVYRDLLAEIKVRVRKAQHRAIQSANAEMIWMYWDIGRMIAFRKDKAGCGAGVIRKLSIDLKNEMPEEKGFSETNLKRMVQFHEEYSALFPIGGTARAPFEYRRFHRQECVFPTELGASHLVDSEAQGYSNSYVVRSAVHRARLESRRFDGSNQIAGSPASGSCNYQLS